MYNQLVVTSNYFEVAVEEQALQEHMVALVRAFGLHRPEETPCGKPIAVAEAHALMDLAQHAPLAQHDLATRLRLEKSTVSRLVSNMEQRGWVARSRSQEDGRVLLLRLTDAGRKQAGELAQARQAKFACVLAAIPAEQRPLVVEMLGVLVEAMDATQ
jgi:DNA-binding MarR family transcriptional regulator